jgi:hypothetical protein
MNTDSFSITIMSLMPDFFRAWPYNPWTPSMVYVGSILVDAGGQMIFMGHNLIYPPIYEVISSFL